MKHFKKNIHLFFILIICSFCVTSCVAKKKTIVINKEVVSKRYEENTSNNNILYLIDGKEVTESFIKNLDTNKIESITVFKGEKDVAKYTDKKYKGVIIIKMKK